MFCSASDQSQWPYAVFACGFSVVGHGPDSLWGKRQPVPDELNISGQRKAAEPGQLVGDVIHMV